MQQGPNLRAQIDEIEEQLMEQRQHVARLRAQLPWEEVADYELRDLNGSTRLRAAFGGRDELLVVHNMGSDCSYCTLWSDGFNGIVPHLESRAAFVVVSPDTPEKQDLFAKSRGWRFRMLSDADLAFTRAMGFMRAESGAEHPWPGVSAFCCTSRGQIMRTGSSPFGPGDLFCPAWHLFGLLGNGVGSWEPKDRYASSAHACCSPRTVAL
jgi:predicted dithiol-disulfide oxidoreductase (DUF899 family)